MSSTVTDNLDTPIDAGSLEAAVHSNSTTPKSRLGEQLIDAGIISADELETALGKQSGRGARLGEMLIEMGIVPEAVLLPFVESQLNVPTTRLREGMIDPKVVRLIPREAAESLVCLAMFKVRNVLTVAMSDPQDLRKVDEIERITRMRVRPVFAFEFSINRLFSRCYEDGFEVDEITADLDESAFQLNAESTEIDLSSVEALVEGSPIINLVNYFMIQGIRHGASDIHIEPSRKYSAVRYRVDGQLREVLRPRRDMHAAIVSRIKVMAKMDIAEHLRPQDGRFQVTVDGREVDFRISTLPTVLGEKVVARILDRKNLTFNLDELGMPDDLLADVKLLLKKPYGLMLVTGPTGSGKTTTLYSALELIKSQDRNIVTVEDPVEYQIELVNQVQVEESRSVTFAAALRSILRQDPDIIMVGEIRDAETAQIAVQAALTGHLVLSTMHTNDCASAVTRLMDMGVASYKTAAALVGVIAQRLCRTVCPECKAVYRPPTELLTTMHFEGDTRRTFTRGEGCSHCHDTGFIGRTALYEVLSIDREMRSLISNEAETDRVRDQHRKSGGRSLLEEGLRLAEAQRTSLEEVMRVAYFE